MFKTMDRKRLIIIAVAVLLIIVVIFLLLPKGDDNKPTVSKAPQGETVTPTNTSSNGAGSSPNNPQASSSPAPTTQELSDTIQKSHSYLTTSNGLPAFGIIRVQQPLAGWYIVTVRVQHAGEPGKVILRQTNDPNNPLTTVAGPSTSFPPEYVSLPDVVRSALKR